MRRTNLVMSGLLLIFSPSCIQPPGTSEVCPLDATRQQLVVEIVSELMRNALFVVDETNEVEQAQALSLVGVDQSYITVAFLVSECEGPQEFDPYCTSDELPPADGEEPFFQTRFQCGELGCEAANVRLSTVYFTMEPITDPGDRHTFTYQTTNPVGTAQYDPNPLITWRVDRRDPNRITFSSDFDFRVAVTPADASEIDLSHAGSLEAIQEDEEITDFSLDFSFPSLGANGLVVEFSLASPDEIAGTVKSAQTVLASVSVQRGGEIEFQWAEVCAAKAACRQGGINAHCP